MDRSEILAASRADLAEKTAQLTALLRGQPHVDIPLGGGSTWTVRDVGAHLCALGMYTELAAGVPSPVTTLDREVIAELQLDFLAMVPETDPGKLADTLAATAAAYLGDTAQWPADKSVSYHAGSRIDVADLTTLAVGEMTLHGLDAATALGVAWPIAPDLAARVLGTLLPLMGHMPDVAAVRGLTRSFGIELRGEQSLTIRYIDGEFAAEPAGGDVDTVISADPAAMLLILSGRLSLWLPVTLGLYAGGGAHPELAYGFPDLFRFC